jgi:UPF0716 family protein affecting phage T7 exclusion
VFVPVGLVDAIVELDFGEGTAAFALGVVVITGGTAVSLFGEVLYSALVAFTFGLAGEPGQSLGTALRRLPYGRLIAADLLYGLVVGVGVLLLIVPGFVFMTWFILIGPVVKLEHVGPFTALRRSRALVRPHFWRVAGIVIPLALASEIVSELLSELVLDRLGHSFVSEWAAAVLSELATAPFFAVFLLVLYVALRERERARESAPIAAA